jgi:RND family efflux transporter MFP subunit
MRKFIGYAVFLIVAGLCGFGGWSLYQDSLAAVESEPKAKKEQKVSVEATPVRRDSIVQHIQLVGSLEPVTAVDIRARISGYLKRLSSRSREIGDAVSAGDVVVEIDDASMQEVVSRAEATKQVAEAQLAAQVARASQASREVDRLIKLSQSGVSTSQQQEQAESALEVAEAEVKLAQAQLNQTTADLQRSVVALNELKISSPISGFIAQRNVEAGDLAKPEDILMRVVNLDRVRTVVNVVERDYQSIREGQAATIFVDAVPGQPFPGVVMKKAPVLDSDTRTARVMIELDNPELLLKPGMHARVSIVAAQHSDVLVVPSAAVHEQNGESYLFVVDAASNTASRRTVVTGIRTGDSVEILSGLEPGQSVLTLGSRLVSDGTKIDVVWTGMTTPEAALAAVPTPESESGSQGAE